MNTKFAVYSLIAVLTGSTLSTFASSDRAVALDQEQAPRPATTAPMRSEMSKSSEVDQAFIEMIVPHHQSANEMAAMALSKAKSPAVKKLAQSIIQDQSREMKQMQTWYKQWYGTEIPMMAMSQSMGQGNMSMSNRMGQAMMMSMMQQDMMDKEMMTALRNAPDFDQEFLRQMTRHHQMATMMAGMVANNAVHPETRKLAQNIIQSQSAEIAQMQQLLLQARKQ